MNFSPALPGFEWAGSNDAREPGAPTPLAAIRQSGFSAGAKLRQMVTKATERIFIFPAGIYILGGDFLEFVSLPMQVQLQF
jgi:hypothetical protein